MCKSSAKILIQRYLQCFCRGLCHCHRHPQDRIGTQIFLVLCSVHAAEFRIYFPLFQYIISDDALCQYRVDMFHGTAHAETVITFFSIAKLCRLKLSCRCSGRHCCPAYHITLRQYFYLYRRISSGIHNFPCVNILDCNKFFHKKDTPPYG